MKFLFSSAAFLAATSLTGQAAAATEASPFLTVAVCDVAPPTSDLANPFSAMEIDKISIALRLSAPGDTFPALIVGFRVGSGPEGVVVLDGYEGSPGADGATLILKAKEGAVVALAKPITLSPDAGEQKVIWSFGDLVGQDFSATLTCKPQG